MILIFLVLVLFVVLSFGSALRTHREDEREEEDDFILLWHTPN